MNTNNIIIGIDMDDTIENLADAWRQYLNNRYGYSFTDDDWIHWDVGETYTELTQEQIYEPLNTDEFWETVQPKQDAIEYVKRLIDDGYKVYICTNSHYKTIQSKIENVLLKYFPYIKWNQVIICKMKSLCNFDILVDDNVDNLIYGNYYRILYDRPYNRYIEDAKHNVHRFTNWKDIYDEISRYSQRLTDDNTEGNE